MSLQTRLSFIVRTQIKIFLMKSEIHMDPFYDLFMKHQSSSCIAEIAQIIKNILIYVLNMNESLTGFETT